MGEPGKAAVNGPARQAQPEAVHAGALAVMVATTAPRCRSLAELLHRVPGAYPGDVMAVVDQLADDRLLDPVTWQRLRSRSGTSDEDHAASVQLPDPHPLDYDWRWAPRTVHMLLTRCIQATSPGDTIALLGTPTLLAAAAIRRERRWLLLEASQATTAALASRYPDRVVRCDLASGELPELHAQAVVADPPWYPDDTRVFLWAAARLAAADAPVLLAQPGPATRPGVLAERAGILSFAQSTGLEAARIHPAALAYVSPPFERTALHAAGLLPLVPLTWRRGDLIELRRTRAPTATRPQAHPDGRWREVTLNGARIRFRLDAAIHPGAADPRLVRLVTGDILPTVSRRDPVRDRVRVWTASNRVFGCQAPALLARLADALARQSPVSSALTEHLGRPPNGAEHQAATQAIGQLEDLTRAERRTATATAGAALLSAATQARDTTAGSTP
jgi:hypothetical protein